LPSARQDSKAEWHLVCRATLRLDARDKNGTR
jgi:hypothetical protein